MRIAVAGDDAGEGLAKTIADHLKAKHAVDELSKSPNDATERYATLADRVGTALLEGKYDRAVLICGTGIGVSISANKIPGIRAALCHDTYSATRATLSNNAQIVTMGARVIGPELAKAVVDAFLAHEFDENGRSAANVKAINDVDEKYRGER